MARKQKLELTWIGKENRARLEPRILIEDQSKSYHAKFKYSENEHFDNMLIHGDNLLVLKAIEQEYSGKVKCIYIDPPYNTGSAFEHYEDGIEHSLWLSLMRDRLEILKNLLSDDGAIWVSIDDNECHYLKVLMDEVFGRSAFICSVVWENFYGRSNAAAMSPAHNYILLYSPMGLDWKNVRNLLPRGEEGASKYKNPDKDPRGPWRLGPIFANGERHEGLMYTITTPSGRKVSPPKGSHWRILEEQFWKMVEDGRIVFGEKGDNIPAIKLFLSEVQDGMVPRTWWPHSEAGHTQEAKREIQALFTEIIPFDTPKPERLLKQIITISTNPGDIVLDSFLGSGTTAAVAHKMGRRWIGIELGDHCYSHCLPRLQKVVDGEDTGGVSVTRKKTESVKLCKKCKDNLCDKCADKIDVSENGGEILWKGGGGFRFFELGPSLISKDQWGNPVINPDFNPAMLAEAMCKLEGFTYAPSDEFYWIHGHSTETDFIYVTTQFMSREMLAKISDEVGSERSLLVCCTAFKCDPGEFTNLTLKKIPKAVLKKCEWGHDDYSLAVENLPEAPPEPDPERDTQENKHIRKFGKASQQLSFFNQILGDK